MNITAEFNSLEYKTYITTLITTIFNSFRIGYYICAGFQLICFIFFISKVFQKHSYFSTKFFFILYFGYGFVLATILLAIIVIITQNIILNTVVIYLNAYTTFFWGPWNTLMALNRFTAVFYWKSFDKIWSKKRFIGAIIALLLYPATIIFYIWIRTIFCNDSTLPCYAALKEEPPYMEIISNGLNIFITAFLGFFTAFSSRFHLITVNERSKKFEKFMIFQSILSLFIMGFNIYTFVVNKISPINAFSNPFAAVLKLTTSFYIIYFQLLTTILLFVLSRTVRQNFIQFYFGKCFNKTRVIRVLRVPSVTNSPTTMINTAVVKHW